MVPGGDWGGRSQRRGHILFHLKNNFLNKKADEMDLCKDAKKRLTFWTVPPPSRLDRWVIVESERRAINCLTRGSLWKSQPDKSAATPDEAEIGWKLANMNSTSIFSFLHSFTPLPLREEQIIFPRISRRV